MLIYRRPIQNAALFQSAQKVWIFPYSVFVDSQWNPIKNPQNHHSYGWFTASIRMALGESSTILLRAIHQKQRKSAGDDSMEFL